MSKPLVLPQEDFAVEVTAADIALGVRQDCWRCPVALAFARHIAALNPRRFFGSSVDHTSAVVSRPRVGGYVATYLHDAYEWIVRFDREGAAAAAPVTVKFSRADA